ncbi:MAG: hypothetical protein GY906_12695 [bacterium]|nr:hypothetical protein [bacterium]
MIVLVFLAFAFWAVVCWWCALEENRFSRLVGRISPAPTFLVLLTVVSLFFILDLLSSIGRNTQLYIEHNALAITVLMIVLVAFFMLLLSAVSPRVVLIKTALLLTVTGFSIASVEIVFRWLLVDHLVPRTNREFELRVASAWNEPIATDNSSNRLRIIGLSDSFGLAGSSQNYHRLIGDKLKTWAPPYEIVNFSVAGYELQEELILLKRFGAKYDPDLVLHGIFVGNDFWGSMETTPVSFRDMPLELRIGLRGYFPRHFLIRQLFSNVRVARQDTNMRAEETNVENQSGTYSRTSFLDIERKRTAICLRSIRADDQFWKSVSGILDQIYAQSRDLGAQYVVVIHPDQFQVEPELFNELVKRYELNPNDYDLEQPQRFLRSYCTARGLPFVDLLPVFRSHEGQEGLYLLNDTHYNEHGNRLAAEQVLQLFESGVVH